jgi:hypothetical protein
MPLPLKNTFFGLKAYQKKKKKKKQFAPSPLALPHVQQYMDFKLFLTALSRKFFPILRIFPAKIIKTRNPCIHNPL